MSKKKAGKVLYFVVMFILVAVFLTSAILLGDYAIKSFKSQNTYNELQELVQHNKPTRPPATIPPATEATGEVETVPTETEPLLVTVVNPATGEEVQVLPQYAELYNLNPDLVGWIEIPGTKVNYPVVQRSSETDYYLYRDFYGNYDPHGCLYAREQCNVAKPSDNITIYGHRMNDGTMMGEVGFYEKKSFWEEHPIIYFDTLAEEQIYQIIYVFKTTASVGEGFRYHLYVDFTDESVFDEFITGCRQNALYDTGLTAEYGDTLITLSTCEYTLLNGRLVVVAKRIK